ncbi:hypothetical protein FA95DRAFT_1504207, partial [Auriscalpium vulgare]
MSAARRALRQKHNAILPVERLPPEILRIIFTSCAEIDPPLLFAPLPKTRIGWLAVTHTCRRWRDVALEHSGLWAQVSRSLGPEWADTFVERAKMMPL